MIRAACALAIASAGCRAASSAAPGERGGAATAASEPSCAAIYPGALSAERFGRAGQPVRVAALADARGASAATVEAVSDLARQIGAAHPDLVLALGGLAADADGIARLVAALGPAGAPVAALPGDREPQQAFHDGLERARSASSGGAPIDLQRRRALDGPALDLIALPGYRWPGYLTEGDCRYRAEDLAPLAALAARLDGPRLLAAYTPPRGVGDQLDGAALGDPDLRRALPPELAPFGLFGHGRGATAPEGTWRERLDVAVGAADASGCPEAVLLEVDAGRARYRRLHARSASCAADGANP